MGQLEEKIAKKLKEAKAITNVVNKFPNKGDLNKVIDSHISLLKKGVSNGVLINELEELQQEWEETPDDKKGIAILEHGLIK
jgi:hypothetical protein